MTMSNNDRMLQLVLSDDKLISFYEYDPAAFTTIAQALLSENPIVVTVAKIIESIGRNHEKGYYKDTYNEIINYLNKNLL